MGEVLWDVFGATEYLGGAPLNFSVASQRLGNTAALLTAVGVDERGSQALRAMQALGLTTEFVERTREWKTGSAIVETDGDRNAVFRIDRPAAFDCVTIDTALLTKIVRFAPDWLYFGTLAQANPRMESTLLRLAEDLAGTKRFYDVNLRTGNWTLSLVEKLSSATDVLKLNRNEAALLYELSLGGRGFSLADFCRQWAEKHAISTICVTLGSAGCAIFAEGTLRTFPGFAVKVVDTVGAGDAFAAAFLHGLSQGWALHQNAAFANALGAIVASRAGATPEWKPEECLALMASRSASCTNLPASGHEDREGEGA